MYIFFWTFITSALTNCIKHSKNRLNAPDEDRSQIPQIIHYIWFGGIPAKDDIENVKAMATLNPDYKINVWFSYNQLKTLEQSAQLKDYRVSPPQAVSFGEIMSAFTTEFKDFPRITPKSIDDIDLNVKEQNWRELFADGLRYMHEEISLAFPQGRNMAAGSDLARYMILLRYGGVYLDFDCKGHRPLGPLNHLWGVLYGYYPIGRPDLPPEESSYAFINGIMAASKGSKMMAHILGKVIANYQFLKTVTKADEVPKVWDLGFMHNHKIKRTAAISEQHARDILKAVIDVRNDKRPGLTEEERAILNQVDSIHRKRYAGKPLNAGRLELTVMTSGPRAVTEAITEFLAKAHNKPIKDISRYQIVTEVGFPYGYVTADAISGNWRNSPGD